MRGKSVIYFPEIRSISRDRVAVEGNRPNFGEIGYVLPEAYGCYLFCSNSIWWRFQVLTESTVQPIIFRNSGCMSDTLLIHPHSRRSQSTLTLPINLCFYLIFNYITTTILHRSRQGLIPGSRSLTFFSITKFGHLSFR